MTAIDRTSGLRHWTPRAAPAICTTTILITARVWNINGAEHSVGAAVLMGAFAVGSAAAGAASASGPNGDPAITAIAFSGAAAFAMAGVAAYADPLPLPILLWLIATVAVYGVCAKYWREDYRAEYKHLRKMERDRQQHQHAVEVEAIRARAAKDVAASTADAAYAAQLLAAHQHRQMLDVHPELAGYGIAADILLGSQEKKVSEH